VQQQQAAQEKGGISLQYRISRGMPGTGPGRAAPPPRMNHFGFTPVETPHGLFRMSVDFAPSSTVTILKETTSPGPVAQVPLPNTNIIASGARSGREVIQPCGAGYIHLGRL
jgi:hypothetical protein